MGLIARHAEAAGIPTLCMGSALDIMRAVNPPRAVFLDFPLGHTTGKPGDPGLQREILQQALTAFETFTVPGQLAQLPFRWDADDGWKQTAMTGGDLRTPRHETPQYQCEDDRARAEGAACSPCRAPI